MGNRECEIFLLVLFFFLHESDGCAWRVVSGEGKHEQ